MRLFLILYAVFSCVLFVSGCDANKAIVDFDPPEEVVVATLVAEDTAVLTSTATLLFISPTAQSPISTPQSATPSPQYFGFTQHKSPPPDPQSQPTPIPEPVWLSYLNQFRLLADLPLLLENEQLTLGSEAHSEYMAILDNPDARYQSKRNYPDYYSEAGDMAARNSNIFSTFSDGGEYDWAINYWTSAPFNLVPILDPQLESVGFGYYEDLIGDVRLTAVLDVNSGINETITPIYPITFPQDGGKTWITAYHQYEYPNPLTVCDDYQQPTGPPLLLQIGAGDVTPHVTAFSFKRGEQPLAACILDETNYVNEDEYAQEFGLAVLDARDAIVIIPKRPLTVGNTYTVAVEVNGELIEWGFTTVPRPESTLPINPKYELPADIHFIWPVRNHDVYKSFWYKHTGIDLLLAEGDPIVASEDGTVKYLSIYFQV